MTLENFQIRPIKEEDIPILLEMIKEHAAYERHLHEVVCDEEMLLESLFKDPVRPEVLIAEENHTPIGYILFFHNFPSFQGKKGIYIDDLYIRKPFRGKGYGELILKMICKIAIERDCARIEWWVYDLNKKAINFYKSIGAKPMHEGTVFTLTRENLNRLAED